MCNLFELTGKTMLAAGANSGIGRIKIKQRHADKNSGTRDEGAAKPLPAKFSLGVKLLALCTTAVPLALAASPVHAETCAFVGDPQYGSEAPMTIDADCVDPDYNDKTFVLDSTKSLTLALPDGSTIPYNEVMGLSPAMRTAAQLPAGVPPRLSWMHAEGELAERVSAQYDVFAGIIMRLDKCPTTQPTIQIEDPSQEEASWRKSLTIRPFQPANKRPESCRPFICLLSGAQIAWIVLRQRDSIQRVIRRPEGYPRHDHLEQSGGQVIGQPALEMRQRESAEPLPIDGCKLPHERHDRSVGQAAGWPA
jgi:hypothetical protein